MRTDLVACPCCGTKMDPGNVVCWDCYRATNRLTPGWVNDVEWEGSRFLLTADDIAEWDAQRDART